MFASGTAGIDIYQQIDAFLRLQSELIQPTGFGRSQADGANPVPTHAVLL